jgi:hypothetical protein
MAGVTSTIVKESLEEIAQRLSQTSKPIIKERLQVLYWLKQEKAPSIVILQNQLVDIEARCKNG